MGSIGSWIVGIILVAIIAWIVYKLIQDKRHGKFSCCGNCSGCTGCGSMTQYHDSSATSKKKS
ncbi:MAG: FeoB-associated Cys-rich membrane protein [Ruminococcus sp.]|nr:FeoB-associated Cys-rich membrane protein [Ruminococcus sp.]